MAADDQTIVSVLNNMPEHITPITIDQLGDTEYESVHLLAIGFVMYDGSIFQCEEGIRRMLALGKFQYYALGTSNVSVRSETSFGVRAVEQTTVSETVEKNYIWRGQRIMEVRDYYGSISSFLYKFAKNNWKELGYSNPRNWNR
jgi:hypothetical protein